MFTYCPPPPELLARAAFVSFSPPPHCRACRQVISCTEKTFSATTGHGPFLSQIQAKHCIFQRGFPVLIFTRTFHVSISGFKFFIEKEDFLLAYSYFLLVTDKGNLNHLGFHVISLSFHKTLFV